jgi:hypothetical protein
MSATIARHPLSYMPSAWLLGAVATVSVGMSKDPLLLPLLVSAWVTMLLLTGASKYFDVKKIAAIGGERLTLNTNLWKRDRFRYMGILAIVAVVTGLILTSELTFAAPATGGGCTNLGFLNPLGTFATSVLQGVTSTTTSPGGGILETMCRFIGWVLLATVIGGVLGFGYVSVQLIQSPGNFGTSIYVLITPVFFVLSVLALFSLVGII